MPKLYVVATPIGNLQDLSPRARDVLESVGFIACEDTRQTMKLCEVFSLHTPLVACHMHNEDTKGVLLAQRMLDESLDAALVTDAGTPCISDPGYLFVQACWERGIEVLTVPGCCAAPSAISVSGMDAREWTFYGFLPRDRKERREKLQRIGQEGRLCVIHESPYRVLELMEAICETLPGSMVSVSCDLTKLHECTLRGTAEDVLLRMRANPKTEKGEYCLVLSPAKPQEKENKTESAEMPLPARIFQCLVEGMDLRAAQACLTEAGYKKNAVKQAALQVKRVMEENVE
ncbi:MAG: 16S rRNA (cytidine(1402)-2'-O)-methyltransferase [Clostridia bacterium]|nr:16S rRNA (cytidine(1402)-2'-O)-methyltransferase [Clostridia bacterium]